MNADQIFAALVYFALPAALLYPLIYLARVRWWKTWVGQALLIKASGAAILLSITGLFQIFGPDYWGRDFFRNVGMALFGIGVWYALIAMLREFGFFAAVRRIIVRLTTRRDA